MVQSQFSPQMAQQAPNEHARVVAQAFDSIAASFDTTLENDTTARIRAKLYSIIESLAPPGSTILDVTCGTGIDALYLANHGYQVFGTDISKKMIRTARSKAEQSSCRNVHFAVASYDSISQNIVPSADLVFSNFGGLNCTSNLASAARAIASVTKSGGFMVGVIMPPFSLWESISYLARFEWRNAVRRLKKNAPATGFSSLTFPVHYYTPGTVAASFSTDFELIQITGLSIVSPTPQSRRFVQNHSVLTKILVGLDGLIERIPIIRAIGDHYIIVLRKKK